MSDKYLAAVITIAIVYVGVWLWRRNEDAGHSRRGFRIFAWIVGTAVALNLIVIVLSAIYLQ